MLDLIEQWQGRAAARPYILLLYLIYLLPGSWFNSEFIELSSLTSAMEISKQSVDILYITALFICILYRHT